MLLAFDWTELAQQIVVGLASGGVWATLALALVLIYRSTGVVNFAQGEMAMFSTFIAWSLVHHGLSFWAAFFLTIGISFVGGVLVERVGHSARRERAGADGGDRHPGPVLPRERRSALDLVARAAHPAERLLDPADRRRGRGLLDPGHRHHRRLLGAVGLFWLFFRFTKLGLASRAAAVNPESSRLLGVRVSWMLALGWGLAAAMGAVSGMLAAPALASFDQNLMQPVLLYAFAGAVLGGIDSPLGAVVGSLILGVLVNLIGTYLDWVGTELRLPVALAVILGVLLIRPAGLFGHEAVRRV